MPFWVSVSGISATTNDDADEEDPELMYQDYECFPSAWYSESGIDEDTFDKSWNMPIWMRMTWKPMRSLLIASAMIALTASKSAIWASGIQKDFAEHIIDECYNLDDMMGHLASYFDYEAYARDLFIDDFYFTDGYVFRR